MRQMHTQPHERTRKPTHTHTDRRNTVLVAAIIAMTYCIMHTYCC